MVKLVDVSGRTYLRYGDVQSRSNSISAVVSAGKKSVLTVKINGEIEHYTIDVQDDSTQLLLEKSARTDIERPTGMKQIIQNGTYSDKMLIYNAQGSVSVYDSKAIKSSKANLVNFDVKGPLSVAAMCNNGGVLFGGKENDAKLYSIETQKEIWAAKNVSQDNLHLRVPVWITCMSFRNPLVDSFEGDSSVFYTGTAYRHVRMYDMKTSQKPTATLEIGPDFRVSAIQPARGGESDRLLYVSDTTGGITQWDMRTQRRVHTLKGASGSIREMSLSEDGKHLACVGLDRFLRVYDTTSNKLAHSIYLKNRLNTCVFVAGKVPAVVKEATKKRAAVGARVDNVEDDDELHELGNSSDEEDEEEEEEGSEGEEDEEEGSEQEESVDENGEEVEGSEGSEGEEQFSSEGEEGSEEEEEGSEGEEDDEEEGDSQDEGSDDDEDEEGSEGEGSESEEEVVASFKWGGASKDSASAAKSNNSNGKTARPAAVAAPAKKARR